MIRQWACCLRTEWGNKTKGSFLMAAIKYASFCFLLLRGLNTSHYKHNFHNAAVHLIIGATFLHHHLPSMWSFLHKLTAASAATCFVINEHLKTAVFHTMVQRNLPIRYAHIRSIRRRTATRAGPSITYNPSSCQLMFHLAERENSEQTADDRSAVRLENEYAFSSEYMFLNHLLQRKKKAPKSTSSNLLVKRAGKADLPFFLNT